MIVLSFLDGIRKLGQKNFSFVKEKYLTNKWLSFRIGKVVVK